MVASNFDAMTMQDIMLCFEMPLFAWMHYYAFPHTDYNDSRLSSRLTLEYAVKDALGCKDIVRDAYYTFFDTHNFPIPPPVGDIWAEDDENNVDYDEQTPIRHIYQPTYGIALGYTEDDACSLEFKEPEDSEEADYSTSRRFVYGDFNFPVIHEDPRFLYPPDVQAEVEQHTLDFAGQGRGEQAPRRREFDSRAQIEDRLLHWENISRSDQNIP